MTLSKTPRADAAAHRNGAEHAETPSPPALAVLSSMDTQGLLIARRERLRLLLSRQVGHGVNDDPAGITGAAA